MNEREKVIVSALCLAIGNRFGGNPGDLFAAAELAIESALEKVPDADPDTLAARETSGEE